MLGKSRVEELPPSVRVPVCDAHTCSRLESYKGMFRHVSTPHPDDGRLDSLKTGACGDDPKGVICAAGCQGGMKLKIPNPGVSGDESTAPL